MVSAAEQRIKDWGMEVHARRRALRKELRLLSEVDREIGKVLALFEKERLDESSTPPPAVEEPTPAPPPEDPILFTVNSATQRGLVHLIRDGKDGPYCDCTAASFGNRCWHLSNFFGSDDYRAYKYQKYAAPSLGLSPDAKPTETFYTSVPGGR